MAISLGQAALAFAGGAAGAYNEDVRSRRDHAQRLEQRAKELQEMHQYRVAEVRFANELQQELQQEQSLRAISMAGGPDSEVAQIWAIQQQLGIDPERAAMMLSRGFKPDMSIYQKGRSDRAGITVEALKQFQGDSRMKNRITSLASIADKYAENTPEIPDATDPKISGYLDLFMQQKDPKFMEAGGGIAVVPPGAQSAGDIQWSMPPEKSDKTSFAEARDMYIGPNGDLIRLTRSGNQFFEPGSDTPVDMSQYTVNNPEAIRDEMLRLQNERRSLEELVASGEDVPRNTRDLEDINKRIEKLTSFGRTEADADYLGSSQRRVDDLNSRLSAVNSSMRSLKRLGDLSEAQVGGVPGTLSVVASNIGTQIRGITDSLGITAGKKDSEMLGELKAAGLDLKDPKITSIAFVRGMQESERVSLFYGIASAMRESGRRDISNADVERAVGIIDKLSGSDSFQGSMVQLETIFKGRIREITKDIISTKDVDPGMRLNASVQYARTVDSWEENVDYLIDRRTNNVYINMGPNQPAMSLQDFLFEFDSVGGF